jgi:hypothetical protein
MLFDEPAPLDESAAINRKHGRVESNCLSLSGETIKFGGSSFGHEGIAL